VSARTTDGGKYQAEVGGTFFQDKWGKLHAGKVVDGIEWWNVADWTLTDDQPFGVRPNNWGSNAYVAIAVDDPSMFAWKRRVLNIAAALETENPIPYAWAPNPLYARYNDKMLLGFFYLAIPYAVGKVLLPGMAIINASSAPVIIDTEEYTRGVTSLTSILDD
jgi:hypothetical protein